MGLFRRKDGIKLFEYIDDIATKVACTYVGLLVPSKKIQDEDLALLANDKIKSAAVVFAICSRQTTTISERKRESVLPVLLQRVIYHLTREIFSNDDEDNEKKVLQAFNEHLKSYYELSTDAFKLFTKLTNELNLIDKIDNQLMQTILITDTVTKYMSRTKINEFAKSINKLA